MKYLLLIALLFVMVAPVHAAVSFYGWEDGGTLLGMYGTTIPPLFATNVGAPDPVYAGLRSLKIVDNGLVTGETPQAYIAWIKGLSPGQTVTVTVFIHDLTAGLNSGRIWAHYNDSTTDVMGYAGSAGGFATYSGPNGWGSLTYTWTMPATVHYGLVIEIRTYTNAGDTIFVDNLEVIHPDGTTCEFPPAPSAVEQTTWTAVKALFQ